ncbi:Hop family adhesin HopQ [Helicobacter pylori]|uniref:Outer membrane function n=1 Tax=Helicobacter pylori (strain J99 / ATCC 700824) TaxID=85963 RepID=Q9ZK39_HELPJ|nr:Hop family adhesin HopQ [Helicobacter pylori]AAD06683.1 putative Outer membrane function [Helicobacter pylori J99]AKE82349.1 membrane protein [Helicobacter pylori J99]AVL48262.1 outer membrane beta-barrel protein [Helicobacter pylori]NPT20419.1 Hop family adhesin HopQ [Helicobacter pylori]
MKKTKKTILLSLTLAASLLHAEDNGVFLSVGYQIGEAVQKVKNADKVQKLSDVYEQLSKLLANDNGTSSKTSAQAINQAVNNLNESAKTLAGGTTNSPAYQATLLALRSALGLWNSMGYAVVCGGYIKKPGENNQKNFHYTDENGNGTTINCGGSTNSNGTHSPNGTNTLKADKNVSLSIEQYEKIHEAYQILSKALKQAGLAPLNSKGEKLEAHVTTSKDQQGTSSDQTTTTTSVIDTTNDAQNLLTQAQTIVNTLKDYCPMLIAKSSSNGGTNGANTPSWQTAGGGKNSCATFGAEFSAISDMISNAQKIVQETQQLNANQPKNITQPNNFNLNSPGSLTALAQSMLKNAQSQTEILKLANQVASDFDKLSSGYLKDYIGKCDVSGVSSSNMTPQNMNTTWGKGCAGVEETLTSLKASTTDFNNQTTPQLDQAQTLANTLTQELGNNPFKRVGIIGSQTNNGAMNGLGVQAGYKQFFGQKRRWGLRYYGFFDYNHTYIKSSFFNSSSDVLTYGVGSDLLFNFINDKNTNFLGKNNKISVGLFGGIALAGTSWLNSQFVNLKTISNVYSAKVNTANFQFLFNLGLRTNLARPKKKDSDHSAQHGMELGVKIPTINTNYYSYLGTKLEYRRLYSVYLNYVFAY